MKKINNLWALFHNIYGSKCVQKNKITWRWDTAYRLLHMRVDLRKNICCKKLALKWPITYGTRYRESRNRVTSTIKAAGKAYFSVELFRGEREPRTMCTVLKNLMGRQKSTQWINTCELVTDGKVIDSASDIGNCLIICFVNVGCNSLQGSWDLDSSFIEYIPMRNYYKLKLEPVTEDEVKCIVSKVKKYKCWVWQYIYQILSSKIMLSNYYLLLLTLAIGRLN